VKILVTGAAGQLGRCLARALAAHEMVALGHAALDITRFDAVRDAVALHRPALVINASAFNDVDGAESRSAEAYAVNALGSRNLAVASAASGIPLVHVSTDYVFDGAAERPYHEFDRPNPLSVYGASKLAGEDAVRTLNPRHYVVRTAWLFWEGGNSFLLSMYARAASPGLRVVNDQYGSPTYAPHMAEGIAHLIETGAFGTYHMAGAGGTTRYELTRELFRLLRLSPMPQAASRCDFPAAAARPRYSVLTTIQDPRIELPAWQEGVAQCARAIASARK
jgi:dTDP-4-dehydrorhamnose reductase